MKRKLLSFILSTLGITAQAQIDAISYPFSYTTGIALADMSSGTTQLVGPNTDDGGPPSLANIGFNFRFAGTRYTQFHPSANGFIRLGQAITSPGTVTEYSNSFNNQNPSLAPYWDDLFVGNNGKIHYKVTGTAPNRKCIIEWKNIHVPYNSNDAPGNATFQVWLSETSGIIQYVYGNGLVANTPNSGYSIGISASPGINLSVVASSNSAQTAQFNTNTLAIPTGTSYTFTPNLPAQPSGLNFTGTTAVSTTLNWTDNATNELAYEIFRSEDGGLNYQFIAQLPADATSFEQTLLQPATNYLFMVAAATSGGRSFISNNVMTNNSPLIISNGTGGGNWNITSTWSGGVIPTASDSVIIRDGDAVSISGHNVAYHVTIGEGVSGILDYNALQADTLTIGGSILVKPGAIFRTAATGGITTHACRVKKNITNNGTLDFSDASQGTELIFFGTGNSLLNGSGSTTDLLKLSASKFNVNEIVELNLTSFSVGGASNNATSGLLQSASGTGTIKFSGSNSFSGTLWSSASYNIPSSLGIWLNNPNFIVQPMAGNCSNNGLLNITNGTYNIGNSMNNSLISNNINGALIVAGGVLNISGRLQVSNGCLYHQTGGAVNVATVGNNTNNSTSVIFNGCDYRFTGGTLTIVQPNTATTAPFDYQGSPATRTLTGSGTVIFGNAGTSGGTALFRVYGNIPNVIVSDNTGGTSKTARIGFTVPGNGDFVLNSEGTIEVKNTAVLNLNNYMVTLYKMENNGTVETGGILSDLYFTGASTGSSYSGSGVCGTNTNPLGNLSTNKTTGFSIDNAITNNIIALKLNLFNGAISNAHKITLGTGGSSTCAISIGGSSNLNNPGIFNESPVFNLGTGGQTLTYLSEQNPRTTGFEVNPTRTLTNLNINNNYNDLTVAGGNITVTNNTTLNNRNMNLGGHTLTIGTSPVSLGTFVTNNELVHVYNGKFARWVPATSSGSYFPVGNGLKRQGAFINYTTAPVSGGLLTGEWKSLAPGNNGLPLTDGALTLNQTNANGYWTIEASNGLAGGVYYFAGTAKGLNGIADYTQLALVKRADNNSPWTLSGTHFPPTGNNDSFVIYRTDLTSFSDFGIAGSSIALPLHLLSFHGQNQTDYNLLQWETIDEKNMASFDLERSDNGVNFSTITEVPAKNSRTNSYRYHDYDTWNENTRYYRLIMHDRDGSTTHSNIIRLVHQQKGSLSIYPNPVQNNLNLEGLAIGSTIILRNAEGKLLLERITIAQNEKIDMKAYIKGIYLLQYVFAGGVEEFKVVKE